MGIKETDARWEKKLGIQTGAANHEKDDANHSRYEPTPYAVLERLSGSGHIGKNDVLVDYGCGKGRVGFYMSYATGCRSVGVEYDARLCQAAEANIAAYSGRRDNMAFVCENAEVFCPDGANIFYFFNPFSVKILTSVLGRIYESYYTDPRPMKLLFYYALDDYLSYLMTEDMLEYAGATDCRDLFDGKDEKEKIHIFTIG